MMTLNCSLMYYPSMHFSTLYNILDTLLLLLPFSNIEGLASGEGDSVIAQLMGTMGMKK